MLFAIVLFYIFVVMKKLLLHIILSLFFLLSLVACTHATSHRKELVHADSLADVKPHEALALLDSIGKGMSSAPLSEQKYYQLLVIKAKDKASINQDCDSLIHKLVDYYETNNGEPRLLSLAYYYAGRIYRNMNDAPLALSYLQQAMDKLPKDDTRQRGIICSQMGKLLTLQTFYDQALAMHFKSYDCCHQEQDTTGMIISLTDIAYVYSKYYMADSSFYYQKQAYDYAVACGNNHLKILSMSKLAVCYMAKNRYQEAWEFLRPAVHSNDTLNRSSYYSIALDLFAKTNQYDSAFFYAKQLMSVGSVYAKKQASEYLTDYYLLRHDEANMSRYLKLNRKITDSVEHLKRLAEIAQIDALYNYGIREKEIMSLRLDNEKKTVAMTLALSVSVLMLLFSFFLFYRYRTKKRMHMERLEQIRQKLYLRSQEYINSNKEKMDQLEKQLLFLDSENKLMKEAMEKQCEELSLANDIALQQKNMGETSMLKIKSSPVYHGIQRCLDNEKVIPKNLCDELVSLFDVEYEAFRQDIQKLYSPSYQEYLICMFIKLGISPTGMSVLLGRSVSAISKVRSRLYTKLTQSNGSAKDLDSFINKL